MPYKKYIPIKLADCIGQKSVIDDIKVQVSASNSRETALEHVLFYGPPGTGKTTVVRAIAQECGVKLIELTGSNLTNPSELKFKLYNLKKRDILFIDEVHNMPCKVCETLYTPLESFKNGIIPIHPFTLICATNYAGKIDKPLRDRLAHKYLFEHYSNEEIAEILRLSGAPKKVAEIISMRSRGTPRIARDFLVRVDNQREFLGDKEITVEHCLTNFKRQGIDNLGLGKQDREVLRYMLNNNAGDLSGAIGEKGLCAALNIERDDLLELIEPYLMQIGFIQRTSRGRVLTDEGARYLINETI